MPVPPKPPPEPGTQFGRWTVLGDIQIRTYGKKPHRFTRVRCECGTKSWVAISRLTNGYSKSCGCMAKEKHTRLLKSFRALPKTFTENAV